MATFDLPQTWAEFGFEVEETADGSPSLRSLKPNYPDTEKGESMHHSGGAAEETEIIYGRVIRRCFEKIERPHFISVGLGIGYVEMTIAREALLQKNLNFTMESFEIIPELRQLFVAWVNSAEMVPSITAVYDRTLRFVGADRGLHPNTLKNLLAEKYISQAWRIRGDLAREYSDVTPAHTMLFDAFSAKSTPELWDEEFLKRFFSLGMHEDGMISTYACRMSLKRALQQTQFQIRVREGFKSKRNSTLGVRGIFAIET